MRRLTDDLRLKEVLASTRPVLLDFDGPICQIYPGGLNVRAAEKLREHLRHHGLTVPRDVARSQDPLRVLRFAGQIDNQRIVDDIESVLTNIEISAATEAPKTLGSDDFLRACADAGRPVVIVSNNAPEAIRGYLDGHVLSQYVLGVVGRVHGRPQEMKPHPRPLRTALSLLDSRPDHCVLVGDSPSDIQAAKAVGLQSIAYVKAPDRLAGLEAECPDALVADMKGLAQVTAATKPTGKGGR